MKIVLTVCLLLVVSLVEPGCSLVTVPVKAVGSVATATVEATGDVVTAPFDAVSGRERRRDKKARDERKNEDAAARRDGSPEVNYSGGYYPRAQEVQ